MIGRLRRRRAVQIRTQGAQTGLVVTNGVISVSYTHLDVYKRQLSSQSNAASSRPSPNHTPPKSPAQITMSRFVICACSGKYSGLKLSLIHI